MIDKGIIYKDRKGFFLGGFGGYSGPSQQDKDISRAESRRDTPTSFTSNDDNRERYGAQQTATGVVKGGGKAIKDTSGNVVGFEDKKVTGDEGREARNEYLAATGQSQLQSLYDRGVGTVNIPPFVPLSTGINAVFNVLTPFRNKMLRGNIDYFKDLEKIESRGYEKTLEGYKSYMMDRMSGKIDAAGNKLSPTGGDDAPFIQPITPVTGMAAPIESGIASINTPYTFEDYINSFQFYA